jgi:hypothetical protein
MVVLSADLAGCVVRFDRALQLSGVMSGRPYDLVSKGTVLLMNLMIKQLII